MIVLLLVAALLALAGAYAYRCLEDHLVQIDADVRQLCRTTYGTSYPPVDRDGNSVHPEFAVNENAA